MKREDLFSHARSAEFGAVLFLIFVVTKALDHLREGRDLEPLSQPEKEFVALLSSIQSIQN